MTTKQFMDQIMAQNAQILENLDSLNKRVTTLESGKLSTAKTSSKKSTTSTKKKSAPKSETPKQTREERLTEKFGDKEARTKFVELRKLCADEFKTLAESRGKYIAKKSYAKVLNDTTVSLIDGGYLSLRGKSQRKNAIELACDETFTKYAK